MRSIGRFPIHFDHFEGQNDGGKLNKFLTSVERRNTVFFYGHIGGESIDEISSMNLILGGVLRWTIYI